MAPKLENPTTTTTTTTPPQMTSDEILAEFMNRAMNNGTAYKTTDPTTWPYRSAIGVTGRLYEDPKTGQTSYEGYKYVVGGQAPAIFNQPSTQQSFEPLYFSGDDENILSNMAPEELIQVQAALRSIRFLGSYRPGLLDQPTVNAFNKLLGQANLLGMEWKDTAVALYQMPQMGTSSGGSTPTYKLSNPEDLKLVFNQAARNVVGRDLDQPTIDQLVKTFQQNEKNFYTGSGEIVEPPSPEALVQTQLETTAPGEVEAKSYGDYIGLLSQLMGGGA